MAVAKKKKKKKNLHRKLQYLLEDSSLNEGPRVRLYHRSG